MDETEYYRRLSEFVPELARESAIPILIRRGTTLVQHGTATLLAVDTDRFIITAAHVLLDAIGAETSIYAATERNSFVQLTGDWIYSNDEENVGVLDVAALMLKNDLRQQFEAKKTIRLSDVSLQFDVEHAVFCFFGYPSIWSKKNASDPGILECKAVQYTTYTYEGATSSFENFNSQLHLAMNASLDETCDENAKPADFDYVSGQAAQFPRDLGGISGCSVWHIGDRRYTLDKWPSVTPKVVGVETAVYHKKGAMRATRWNAVTTLLKKHFPHTRSILELHEML